MQSKLTRMGASTTAEQTIMLSKFTNFRQRHSNGLLEKVILDVAIGLQSNGFQALCIAALGHLRVGLLVAIRPKLGEQKKEEKCVLSM